MGNFIATIGFLVFIFALLNSGSAESSIHQIYFQLQYVTAAILIGAGLIIINIQSLKNVIEKKNEIKDSTQKEWKCD